MSSEQPVSGWVPGHADRGGDLDGRVGALRELATLGGVVGAPVDRIDAAAAVIAADAWCRHTGLEPAEMRAAGAADRRALVAVLARAGGVDRCAAPPPEGGGPLPAWADEAVLEWIGWCETWGLPAPIVLGAAARDLGEGSAPLVALANLLAHIDE